MRDVLTRPPGAAAPGRPLADRLRQPITWLLVASMTVATAGAITIAAALGGPADPAAAAPGGSARLWMHAPVPGRGAALVAQSSDDATPVSVDLSASPTESAPPSASPSASATPDLSGTCYLPDRAAPRGAAVGGTPAAATPVSGTPAAVEPAVPGTELTRAGYPAGPASDPVAADVRAVVEAVAVCLSEPDYDTLNGLIQDDFRGQLLGLGEATSAEDFTVLAADLPPGTFTIVDVTDVTITAEGDATATVRYLVGNQLRQGAWSFSLFSNSASFLGETDADGIVRPSARWVVGSESVQEPVVPEGAAPVDVTLDEYTIEIDPDEADGDTLVLTVANEGEQDHEVVVLRLEGDAATSDLLYTPGPALPEGISVVGQLGVDAGDEGTLVLQGLEPGSYALVDLYPDEDSGVSNLSLGMAADFEVGD